MNLKIDVKNLVFAPLGQKESYNLELHNEQIDEEILVERIRGTLELTKLEDEILASFSGSAKSKLTCDRCLAEFDLNGDIKFKQEYFLDRKEHGGSEPAISNDFKLDFSDPLRQEILGSLPVKKLCKQDCAGICQNCGKNLNFEKCECKSKLKDQKSSIRQSSG